MTFVYLGVVLVPLIALLWNLGCGESRRRAREQERAASGPTPATGLLARTREAADASHVNRLAEPPDPAARVRAHGGRSRSPRPGLSPVPRVPLRRRIRALPTAFAGGMRAAYRTAVDAHPVPAEPAAPRPARPPHATQATAGLRVAPGLPRTPSSPGWQPAPGYGAAPGASTAGTPPAPPAPR